MNVNLEYYKIFYYVAKHGGITMAARELCISQPAVSQAIKQLEKDMGTPLFTRTSKGVMLNQAGSILYEYVSKGYESIIAGERKLKELTDLDYGEVRIGASDMTLKYFLLPYLEQFHIKYPNIKVNVTNAPTPRTIEHLYAGRIDFGVVSTPILDDHKLEVTIAKNIEDIFVAGNKFWYLKEKMLSYKDLMKLPYICLEGDTSTRVYVDRFLKKEEVRLIPEFELATSDMIVQFAIRNLGIGSVVADFASEAIKNEKVFKLTFDKSVPVRKICVINDDKSPMSVAATKLMDIIKKDVNK